MRTKILFSLILSLIVATISGSVMGFASGLSAPAISAVVFAASFLPMPKGIAPMAVQKEIWLSTIVEGLFADNTFVSKAFNADEFVNAGKTVHIPNAGAASGVVKNRSSFPATVESRTDTDLTFNLDEFTTNPIRIPFADTVELSYNKRESVIRTDRSKIIEDVANDMIGNWSPASTYTTRTTGANVTAHVPVATGDRKALTKGDIQKVMVQFNKDDVPTEQRYMLIDAVMLGQLIDSLTDKEATAFHAAADVKNGIVGRLYGFDILSRSKAGRYTTALAVKRWDAAGATTDHAAVLAWQYNSVCRAMGETQMFDNPSDPTYYGDIYSFLVRAGGRPMRSDVKGLWAIVQDDGATEG